MQKIQSRRSFFRYMAMLGLASFYTTALHAKASKEAIKYQDTPSEGKRCQECMHFVPQTNECKIVEGDISPEGWCVSYYRDPKLPVDTNETNVTEKAKVLS